MTVEEVYSKIKFHQQEMSSDTAKSIRKILQIADKNNDGYISRNDFLQLVFRRFKLY